MRSLTPLPALHYERIVQSSLPMDAAEAKALLEAAYEDEAVFLPPSVLNKITSPITIHTTTRQQIRFRLKTGRFITNV